MTELASIRCGLRAHAPVHLPDPPRARGRAAVALVLGGQDRSLSLCFVKRAVRPGERWSGDMAFPGGWLAPADAGAFEAAVREAREEAGLDLDAAAYVGQLDDRRIGRPGEEADAPVLSSFVFYAGSGLPVLQPDGWEIEAAYWIPLAHLRHRAHHTSVAFESRRLPGIRYSDCVIWGLTLWVFESFEAVIPAASGRPEP